jgi:hypothetical protein
LLREALALDPESPTGLRWRKRPAAHFRSAAARALWMTRYAGRPVKGCPNNRGALRVGVRLGGRCYWLTARRVVAALATGRWPARPMRLKDRAS